MYGTSGFDSFACPEGVNPLLFSQLCFYHHSDTSGSSGLGVSTQTVSQQQEQIEHPKINDLCTKKDQQNFDEATRHIGQVAIGSRKNPIWISGKSVITVPGHTTKIQPKAVCLVEQAEHHNLPLGIIVNRCVASVKARSVPVILKNTTKQNIWLWQPLLATELYTVEYHQVEHRVDMEIKGEDVNISFLPVVPNTIRFQSEQVEATLTDISPPNSSERPVSGCRPDTQAADFDFEAEAQCLPFKLNLGEETKMTHIQQGQFIDLIYDHQEVFSLHDEDLGFCDQIKHTIPMTMDRPVYLPHCTIPPSYKGKCINVLTPGCNRGSLGHCRVLTHPRW